MTTPTPMSKASMDPNFEGMLRDLQEQSQAEYQQRLQGGQVKWFRPSGWSGDLFNVEGYSAPFDRSTSNEGFVEAVQDPANSPGTTGDVVVTTTMIDYLATMERAFRNRYMRRPRAIAHMLGRKLGQGSQQGVFIQNGLEYIRAILKQARATQ